MSIKYDSIVKSNRENLTSIIISAYDTEYGYKHEVGFVQESELFDILDKEIREGLTDEEIEEIRKRWCFLP